MENGLHCLDAAPVWKVNWERGGSDDTVVTAIVTLV